MLFKIDQEKCTKCQACLEECPLKLIVVTDDRASYQPLPGGEEFCIKCGHCVAVCPVGAFQHQSLSPGECDFIAKENLPDFDQVAKFLQARRSIRAYKKEKLKDEVITELIKTASYAPSGHNLQPVNWLVIKDDDKLLEITSLVIDWMKYMLKEQTAMAKGMHLDLIVMAWEQKVDVVCRKAPHLVFAYGPKSNPIVPPAGLIALTYFELAAFAKQLGTCWAGYVDVAAKFWPPLQKTLNFPEGHSSLGAMLLGYPKYSYRLIPTRKTPSVTWR